jgi:large subunit ribosomal protein L24
MANKKAAPKKVNFSVKKGDEVIVLAGKDKGKKGKIMRSIPATGRVVVEKVNMVTKAMRPTQQNPQGGLSKIEAPIAVSNVMLVCPNCSKPTRVGHSIEGDKKVRVCKKCGKPIDK